MIVAVDSPLALLGGGQLWPLPVAGYGVLRGLGLKPNLGPEKKLGYIGRQRTVATVNCIRMALAARSAAPPCRNSRSPWTPSSRSKPMNGKVARAVLILGACWLAGQGTQIDAFSRLIVTE